MLMAIHQRVKQRGIGLLELMLSLAVISVLLVMATRYYKVAHQEQQVNEAISLAEGVIAASANWVVGHPSYQGVNIRELVDQGLLPSDIGDGATADPWHGRLSVSAYNDTAIQISMEKMPAAACRSLANKLRSQTQNGNNAHCNGSTFVGVF